MTSRPASEFGKRRSRTRNLASRCRRRRLPGTASSSSAMRAATSRAARGTCSRSTRRPARSSGSSFWFPRPRATWSADRWARRRSTCRRGKTRPAYPISGGGTWTSYTLDTKTGLLYVPGGNPAPDFAIGAREGDNLYTDSVVVLDAKTGDYKNHFKLVPKDWHDWDVSNPPILIQTMGGKQLMVVAPKDGHLYAFDLANNNAALPGARDPGRECRRDLLARQGGPFLPGRGRGRGMEQPGLRSADEPRPRRRGRVVRHGDAEGCR